MRSVIAFDNHMMNERLQSMARMLEKAKWNRLKMALEKTIIDLESSMFFKYFNYESKYIIMRKIYNSMAYCGEYKNVYKVHENLLAVDAETNAEYHNTELVKEMLHFGYGLGELNNLHMDIREYISKFLEESST